MRTVKFELNDPAVQALTAEVRGRPRSPGAEGSDPSETADPPKKSSKSKRKKT
jgi:hypothetical protein